MARSYASDRFRLCVWIAAQVLAAIVFVFPASGETNLIHLELEQLRRSNSLLEQRLRDQETLIRELVEKVNGLARVTAERSGASHSGTDPAQSTSPQAGFRFGSVHVSGSGAVAFFDSEARGFAPNAEFRVDEARLFIEAPVWQDVYAFGELNLAQREYDGLDVQLGELYLDFENVSELWGKSRQLNIRAGRFDIPFGEEYLQRDAIRNPLISHSIADFWGIDEGIEFYGSFGRASYVFAVQNGGVPGTRDFNSDKSITGRAGYDPFKWLHLSVSAMRTGDLDAQSDSLSELWFGNGWFRSIGSTNTSTFGATVVEGDVKVTWHNGHASAFGGSIWYDDDDPIGDNARHIWFFSIEAVQELTRKLYAATRLGHIRAPKGYPLSGHGNLGRNFFGPFLAEELWRLSLGLGYRFSDNLVLKTEYAIDWGNEVGGADRRNENLLAVQAAMKF